MSMDKSVAVLHQEPIPKEVLRMFLERQNNIPNRVVKDFIRRYVKRLYNCAEEEAEIISGGDIKLLHWTTDEGGSYGYDPANIAYYLDKLNKLFYGLMHDAYQRNKLPESVPEKKERPNVFLSEEMLRGVSCCLGFYVLVNYFTSDALDTDKKWFARLSQLAGEFGQLETWTPSQNILKFGSVQRVLGASESAQVPYYNKLFTANTQPAQVIYQQGAVPTIYIPDGSFWAGYQEGYQRGFTHGYSSGHHAGYQQGYALGYEQCQQDRENLLNGVGVAVVNAELKRLVAFIRSLRQTLDVVQDDPLMVIGKWEEMSVKTQETNEHSENGYGDTA